jgi:2-keto-4-pentenoate hydratase/2-oxohepta-3-ene-1,7-dioic acid hydratase in catechol pathway
LIVKIDRVGKHIDKAFAHKYYSEFSLGIDFTARDIQEQCKANGLPWEKAKAFDSSAAISNTWMDKNSIDLESAEFKFYQNNELKQTGHPRDFIFSIDEIIAYVSQFMTLKTGDLIFTGTPAGVGPVQIGDVLRGELNEKSFFEFQVK